MNRIVLALILFLSIASLSSTAFAQGEESTDRAQFIDMSAMELEGAPLGMVGHILIQYEDPQFERLLSMQTRFVEKVAAGAEEL